MTKFNRDGYIGLKRIWIPPTRKETQFDPATPFPRSKYAKLKKAELLKKLELWWTFSHSAAEQALLASHLTDVYKSRSEHLEKRLKNYESGFNVSSVALDRIETDIVAIIQSLKSEKATKAAQAPRKGGLKKGLTAALVAKALNDRGKTKKTAVYADLATTYELSDRQVKRLAKEAREKNLVT